VVNGAGESAGDVRSAVHRRLDRACVAVRVTGVLSVLVIGGWLITSILRHQATVVPWPVTTVLALVPVLALASVWRAPLARRDLRFISGVLAVWVGLFSLSVWWNPAVVLCLCVLVMLVLIPRRPGDDRVHRFGRAAGGAP
jgi:hypothetical protein